MNANDPSFSTIRRDRALDYRLRGLGLNMNALRTGSSLVKDFAGRAMLSGPICDVGWNSRRMQMQITDAEGTTG